MSGRTSYRALSLQTGALIPQFRPVGELSTSYYFSEGLFFALIPSSLLLMGAPTNYHL